METLSRKQKLALLRLAGSTNSETIATGGYCGCCGVIDVAELIKARNTKPQERTIAELMDGKNGGYAFHNRFCFKKEPPDKIFPIEDGLVGVVIPDKDCNVTIQWRDE